MNRLSISHIRAQKGTTPLVVCTAYSAPIARILDAHADILLVGDSVGMVLYGLPTTRGVTLEMMMAHAAAVVRSSCRALVVADMPFGTYESSPAQALENARKLLNESGAQAVKLEGGVNMEPTIAHLTRQGVGVMSHIGLQPQQVENAKDYRAQGRTADARDRLMDDAMACERAGAFSIVLEAMDETCARQITQQLHIPTIGIGASPTCDGQVLVSEDFLGLTPPPHPRFVKQYADLSRSIETAAAQFAHEVRTRAFPTSDHTYRFTGD